MFLIYFMNGDFNDTPCYAVILDFRSAVPESLFYNRTFSPNAATSLTDPVLGGNVTSITHTLTVSI